MNKIKLVIICVVFGALAVLIQSCGETGGNGVGGNFIVNGG